MLGAGHVGGSENGPLDGEHLIGYRHRWPRKAGDQMVAVFHSAETPKDHHLWLKHRWARDHGLAGWSAAGYLMLPA